MEQHDIERIEVDLLLQAVFERYGYDFRAYARASIERRVRQLLLDSGCNTISAMIPELLHDESFLSRLIARFSITVTDMFRDPAAYRSLREKVIPLLKTYPFVRVWHAGCATGEEAYSLAIVLAEEGLYDRTTIFATDLNDRALETAREGVYPLERIRGFTRNYQQSGGRESFSQYYHAQYENAVMSQALKRNMTFANHNLATDAVFGEMHLILCRNVLIYFGRELQNRALQLFVDSLIHRGFLCLGSKESLMFSDAHSRFDPIDARWRVFQKSENRTRDPGGEP